MSGSVSSPGLQKTVPSMVPRVKPRRDLFRLIRSAFSNARTAFGQTFWPSGLPYQEQASSVCKPNAVPNPAFFAPRTSLLRLGRSEGRKMRHPFIKHGIRVNEEAASFPGGFPWCCENLQPPSIRAVLNGTRHPIPCSPTGDPWKP